MSGGTHAGAQAPPSEVLPAEFHPQLRQLLDQIVTAFLPEWQEQASASTVRCACRPGREL